MATPSTTKLLITFLALTTTIHSAVLRENSDLTTEYVSAQELSPVLERTARSIDSPQKRPFCNAFTGCGRKRSSSGVANMPSGRDMSSFNSGESLNNNNIFDLNSEPAVADIMQQIMTEAKVWDAIQAANRELRKPSAYNNFPTYSSGQLN